MDIAGVAGHLGVCVRHIRKLVAQRRIPYVNWGTCFASTRMRLPPGWMRSREPPETMDRSRGPSEPTGTARSAEVMRCYAARHLPQLVGCPFLVRHPDRQARSFWASLMAAGGFDLSESDVRCITLSVWW